MSQATSPLFHSLGSSLMGWSKLSDSRLSTSLETFAHRATATGEMNPRAFERASATRYWPDIRGGSTRAWTSPSGAALYWGACMSTLMISPSLNRSRVDAASPCWMSALRGWLGAAATAGGLIAPGFGAASCLAAGAAVGLAAACLVPLDDPLDALGGSVSSVFPFFDHSAMYFLPSG